MLKYATVLIVIVCAACLSCNQFVKPTETLYALGRDSMEGLQSLVWTS